MRKTTKHSNYTFTKRGIYYFSKRIPQDIQSNYQQSRIVYSLKTKDKNQAQSSAIASVVFPKPDAALIAMLWGKNGLGRLEGSRACTIEP